MIILKPAIRKTLSVFLCIVLAAMTVVPTFAAVSYPSGVTEQTAQEAAQKTDVLVKEALSKTSGKTLSALVLPQLYSNETLSQILLAVYGSTDEQTSSVADMGIDVSTQYLAQCLVNYPSVSKAVGSAKTWNEVDLSGAKWNVSDKNGFATAMSAILTPFSDLLYMLLCSGTYKAGIITLKGSNGYESGVVPMLSALGCTSILSGEEFVSQAQQHRYSMIQNLVLSIMSSLEAILANPAIRLSTIMPNLAHFLKDGGFESAVDNLMSPLTLGIGKYVSFFTGTKMLSVLMFIQDSGKYTTNFSENMTTILNDAMESSELKLAPIDLDALKGCGTLNEQTNSVEANIAESFTTIFVWLLDTLKLNRDKVSQMLASADGQSDRVSELLTPLLEKDSGEIFALLVKLLTQTQGEELDYTWQTPQFAQTSVSYTANLGKEKFQRVLDGIDELLNEFVSESGQAKSVGAMLKNTIYSSQTLSTLVVELYSGLSDEKMQEALSSIGMSFSPSAVAAGLSERQLSSARYTLSHASSWKNVKSENLNWGFSQGDKKGFKTALVAALRPFEDVLRMMLVADRIEIFSSVNLCGGNGYNTAVIPLLEALGCNEKKILTYEQFKKKSAGDGVLENLLDPVLSLVDEIAKKPVYKLTEILPNLIFFLQNGSAMQCVENLIKPIETLLSSFGMKLSDLGVDLEKLKKTDIVSELSKSIPKMIKDVKLEEPDLASIAGIGSLESYQSKATSAGSAATLSRVKADQTAVLVTMLRYFVGVLTDSENSDLLSGMMGGSGDSNDMFAQYSADIGTQMAQMNTDEVIEWLYKLLFRERAVEQTTQEDDYSTAITYVPQKKSHTKQIVTSVVILLAIVALVIVFRKRIKDLFHIIKQNAAKKKAASNQEV